MVLRAKSKSSPAWRSFTSSGGLSNDNSFSKMLTPGRRGGIYVALLLFVLWAVLGRGQSFDDDSSLAMLKEKAYSLGGVGSDYMDPEVFGPPIKKRAQRPLQVTVSTMNTLTRWGDLVPETVVHGLNGGWAIMDGVVVMNGTLFIVANDASVFPELIKMFSTGKPMESDPATWRGKDPTSKDIQIVSQEKARELFGPYASRIEGVSFLCNDAPQFASHYYHYVAEILFGMWRTYSSLDLNIPSSGISETLVAPRRFMFPHIPTAEFKDYSGISEYLTRAIFPSMAYEFSEIWDDRNQTARPFLVERIVIGDRIAAEYSKEWHGLYKYAAPAFGVRGSGYTFWAPVRRALVLYLGLDELLSPEVVSTDSTSLAAPPSKPNPNQKTVITYVSRQGWGRRTLSDADHNALLKALNGLKSRYGYEVNVVKMEQLSHEEQLKLAVRTTVMLGVHGNGLTHALWMDPEKRPLLCEFFSDGGFSTDYEYPMRELGITYYGWWNSKYFTHRDLPEQNIPDSFQGTDIRIDANAVIKAIRAHVSGAF